MSRKWIRLDAPPGSLIINTGDYMQRITNDRLPSTTHRVGKPKDGSQREKARISFPMAVYEPLRAITFHTRSTSKFYGDEYAVEVPVGES